MEIKILGMGCPKCHKLEEMARAAAAELGIQATFTKVKNMDAIVAYGVALTPALVVNEAVKVSGRLPRPDELRAWLQAAQAGGE
jgi:small redox-active disulfide protein 2